ncbi:hypothetical protein [Vibrio ulleungensis]|uniref:Uncharacterized protein n=1 Tax=Vibrio ulleungensis TaxID=2807619 RepID=A0ABS2HHQ1_9VIBR|nr:hypothetical protein [Vibrio ulleungensis]MBM7036564.1 hypothetical protein [Vibrio ulleungensis]
MKPVYFGPLEIAIALPKYSDPEVNLGAGLPGDSPIGGKSIFGASLDQKVKLVVFSYVEKTEYQEVTISKTRNVYYEDMDIDGDGEVESLPIGKETKVNTITLEVSKYNEWVDRSTEEIEVSYPLPGR